jgi:hypothetical protein
LVFGAIEMEKEILRIISLFIVLGGLYIFLKPDIVAAKIKVFYSNYPLIRYAGEKQLTSRQGFVKSAGIVIIIIGLICLFSILKEQIEGKQ